MLTLSTTVPTAIGAYALDGASFIYGIPNTGTSPSVIIDQAEYAFELGSGEIVITEISEDRVRGTFTATGTGTSLPPGTDEFTIEITSGTFDVPYLLVPPWPLPG